MTEDITQSPGVALADEMYPDPTPPVVDPPADPPVVDEPGDETPADISADEQDTPPVDEPGDDTGGDDENAIEVSSVEELAEHFEFDPEWMQNLTITQKVNGKEVSVQLADALTTHRQVAAGDEYLADAKQKAKGIIDQASNEQTEYAASVAQVGALLKTLETEIDKDVSSIDWARLRADDPAEYSAKREEVRERKEHLDKLKSDASNSVKGALAKNAEKQNQARLERLPEENQLFLDRIPEWNDEKAQKKERDQLVKYLTKDGYSEEQIQIASFNGKLLSMAVKAMRYDQSKTKSDAVKKKLVKVPKVLKPGAKQQTSKPNGKADDPVSILYG